MNESSTLALMVKLCNYPHRLVGWMLTQEVNLER